MRYRSVWGRGIRTSTSTSLVPRSPLIRPKRSFSPPTPSATTPAARPAGRLLLDAQRSSQPSETRCGPSGPSAPPRPHPASDGHSGRPPTHVSFGSDGSWAPHTRPHKTHPLPSLTSSQRSWPRKLSSRALCMPVPEPPPGLPVPLRTPARAARRGPSGRASGAPALRLAPQLLAGRSSRRRRRPNIWQPRPAPGAAANGAGAGLTWPRPSARPSGWVSLSPAPHFSPALEGGAGL